MRTLIVLISGALLMAAPTARACTIKAAKDIDGNDTYTFTQFTSKNGTLAFVQGQSIAFQVVIWQKGQVDTPIAAGGVIKLLLADGTKMSFEVAEQAAPFANVWGSDVLSTWNPKVAITEEQIRQLAASPVQLMEVPLVGQALTLDYSQSIWLTAGKGYQKLAKCWVKSMAE